LAKLVEAMKKILSKFHIRDESLAVFNGFNFYRWSDTANFGFIFRYGSKIPGTSLGSKILTVRYSNGAKKWFIKFSNINDVQNMFSKSIEHYVNYQAKRTDIKLDK